MNPSHRSGRIGLARRFNGPLNGPFSGSLHGSRRTTTVVPPGVEVAAQWAWRFLVITAAVAVCVYLVATLSEIVIPLLIALLVCALISPPVQFLRRHGWPKALAILAVLVGLLLVVGGLALLVTTQIRSGLPQLEARSVLRYNSFRTYLRVGPFHLSDSALAADLDKVIRAVKTNGSAIFGGALSASATAGRIVAGALITLFATIFMLIDGAGVWRWIVRLFPRPARTAVDGAGRAGWLTLSAFVRVQLLVAAADAVGVGLVAFFLGLPVVVPLAVLVLLASFVPLVGAIATGVLAVLIALVYLGPVQAVIMLAGVVVVHLMESHVLQPLVMGSAVRVHPLAVVLTVAGGSFLAGIPGALFAVPAVAVIHTMISYVASGIWREPRPVSRRPARGRPDAAP
ncbi:AI-2E family transporter [Microlunatus sp. Gsoil 973]|uniref:AI-2E family transporter n=1 Tax=Microlunatus sp. Gsoil 973 TaxID=2672569 RepID=UPI001E4C4C02|nr:AI-2E family transporter [Microlunatus sp. Gsoil 973]